MNMNEYVQTKLLVEGKVGYWPVFKALVWGLWVLLVKPGEFMDNGVKVQNLAHNGAFRAFLGGFLFIFTGFWMILAGFVASLAVFVGLLASPWAAYWVIWASRRAAKKHMEGLNKAAEQVVKARNHAA